MKSLKIVNLWQNSGFTIQKTGWLPRNRPDLIFWCNEDFLAIIRKSALFFPIEAHSLRDGSGVTVPDITLIVFQNMSAHDCFHSFLNVVVFSCNIFRNLFWHIHDHPPIISGNQLFVSRFLKPVHQIGVFGMKLQERKIIRLFSTRDFQSIHSLLGRQF